LVARLLRDHFVLDQAVLLSQLNRFFVEALGVQLPTFDPGYLSSNQGRSTPKILRTVGVPECELPMVNYERSAVPSPLIDRQMAKERGAITVMESANQFAVC